VLFDRTGGLHGAALCDAAGEPVVVREDVGRHNAVDKTIGWAAQHLAWPLGEYVLVISGRTSFEIVQKALAAGIATIVAVSAPTSLAVELAARSGITLVGFVRGDRACVYSTAARVV
jgi:FdhD protein